MTPVAERVTYIEDHLTKTTFDLLRAVQIISDDAALERFAGNMITKIAAIVAHTRGPDAAIEQLDLAAAAIEDMSGDEPPRQIRIIH